MHNTQYAALNESNESIESNELNDYKIKLQTCLLMNQTIIDLSNINYTLIHNQLHTFDWLKEVILINSNLNEIPIFTSKLEKINVSHNKITRISNLPDSLIELNISHNYLTKTILDNLPISLKSLN
jgi:hypothetical protein